MPAFAWTQIPTPVKPRTEHVSMWTVFVNRLIPADEMQWTREEEVK